MQERLFSQAQVEEFDENGFLVLRGLFRSQIQMLGEWADELASEPQTPGKTMVYREDSLVRQGERIVSRIENFYPHHTGFAVMLDSADMRGRAGELFGEPAVLFKDKINFKMPGGNGFTPHQDVQAGWSTYASVHITALVTIDPATLENGCLELAANHHRKGMVGELWAPLTDENMKGMRFEPYATEPGDVIFFDSFAPHRSGPNLTDHPRRVLYVTYNKASEGDHRLRYYADKRKSYPPDSERDPNERYVFRV
jgi:2-aminoethylphosphonate dioxygenase